MAGLCRLFGKSPVARDCVVADVVGLKPVSAAKFPITGKSNGNFSEKGCFWQITMRFSGVLSMFCSKIPDALEMGILPAYLGNRSPMADRDSKRPFLAHLF